MCFGASFEILRSTLGMLSCYVQMKGSTMKYFLQLVPTYLSM